MKNLNIFLILIIIPNILNAQTMNEFSFDLNTLSIQKEFSIESILPQIEGDKFYYFNQQTGKKEFEKEFEEAYPFIGKSALIKQNGKYGIIDLKGNYLIKPTYENYRLPPYEEDAHLIIFSKELTFDLNTGAKNEDGYFICLEPAGPNFITFRNENKKYGIKNYDDEIIIKAKYDSILDIHLEFFVVKLNNKIGVIDTKGAHLVPFDYEDLTFSRGDYYTIPQKIGLKKGNEWIYFDLPSSENEVILSSKHKCVQMHDLSIEHSIGIFQEGKRFNILFENGETLDEYYDWISKNGLVGIKNESVYFLNSDGSSTLYYE